MYLCNFNATAASNDIKALLYSGLSGGSSGGSRVILVAVEAYSWPNTRIFLNYSSPFSIIFHQFSS